MGNKLFVMMYLLPLHRPPVEIIVETMTDIEAKNVFVN